MIVLTNCTSRKASNDPSLCLGGYRGDKSLAAIAADWVALTQRTAATAPAGALYCGRPITDARWVAERSGGRLYILSAGLGLVGADDLVPNYDATISGRGNWLADVLRRGSHPAGRWWAALCEAQGRPEPLLKLLGEECGGECFDIKLVALPSSYLAMVAAEMGQLPEKACENLRIFTSPLGQRMLSGPLGRCALPYDERLEMLEGFKGTQADFPQRAMRHFVSHLMTQGQQIEGARSAVLGTLRECAKPQRPSRARLNDSEIKVLLRSNWADGKGRSSALLVQLRRHLGVACEQGRFRDLWREVREEMASNAAAE